MVMSKKRKQLLTEYKNEQNSYSPACETLRKACHYLGISRNRLAARMGIPGNVWEKYENGGLRIPESLMLKIYMFGLDFWCERDL